MSQIVEMVSTDLAVSAVGAAVQSERTEAPAGLGDGRPCAPAAAQGDLLRETAYAVRQRLYQLLTYSRPRPGDAAAAGSADGSAKAQAQRVG